MIRATRRIGRLISLARGMAEQGTVGQSVRFLAGRRAVDSAWYLRYYPDVERSGVHPIVHYVGWGASEGRYPSADFDPAAYLAMVPDAAASALSPLEYHLRRGRAAGFTVPHPSPPLAQPPAPTVRARLRRRLQVFAWRLARRRLALVVDSSLPTPDRDSGSLSTLEYLRTLRDLGYTVVFAPADLLWDPASGTHLAREGVTVWTGRELGSIAEVADSARFAVALLLRPEPFTLVAGPLRSASAGTRIIYVPVDLHFVRLTGEASVLGSSGAAADAQRFELQELENVRRADLTLVLSLAEKDVLHSRVPEARVGMVPMGRTLAEPTGRPRPEARRTDITFLGFFGHTPNTDAVDWFLDEIWPSVSGRLPGARFVVYGASLPESLAARATDSVIMAGFVDDVAEAFASARVFVVPLRFGAGVKGKVVTAMHFGMPIVSTSVGVEGMELDGEVLVADDAVSFADEVVRLYEDAELRARLSEAALATAQARFSPEALRARLSELLRTLEG